MHLGLQKAGKTLKNGHPEREIIFKNSKLLSLGRQIGLKFFETFQLFLAKLSALFWHYESLNCPWENVSGSGSNLINPFSYQNLTGPERVVKVISDSSYLHSCSFMIPALIFGCKLS